MRMRAGEGWCWSGFDLKTNWKSTDAVGGVALAARGGCGARGVCRHARVGVVGQAGAVGQAGGID